ncbi:Gfo/Idh/MocA family oxidoreductase [Providencia hangzhouensis]
MLRVIYIGLPNHLHFQYTFDALMADKHVVCEKPFTPN